MSPTDASIVAKCREAGLIVTGLTNMDEFGMGSFGVHSRHGPTSHPFDPDRVAGGSSSGSAAAVALDIVPL